MTSQWSIGDITIARIDSANFLLPADPPMPAWAVPVFTPSVDQTPIAFSALVVRTGAVTLVVDPWLVDESPRFRPNAEAVVDGLLAELAQIGVAAGDVSLVINSHIDGMGWNIRPSDGGWRPTFANARYLFPAAELEAVDRGEPINGAEHLAPLFDAGVVDRVDGPLDLAPGVSLVPAPGHNFGHVAVRVEREGELAIYLGHLVLSLSQIDDPYHDAGDSDLAVASETRIRVLDELADRRGVLLTTLVGGPGGGVVQRQGQGYRLVLPD